MPQKTVVPATMYRGSKGLIEISRMNHMHVKNALRVLKRNNGNPAEIAGLEARKAQLDVVYEQDLRTERDGAEPLRQMEIDKELQRLADERA